MKTILVGLCAVVLLAGCGKSLGPKEINAIKTDIRMGFEEKGWTNVRVELIPDSDTKMSGFVKGTNAKTFCIAELDEMSDLGYTWECL